MLLGVVENTPGQSFTAVSTPVAAIVTGAMTMVAAIIVAWIGRRGDKRTDKSETVPQIMSIYGKQVDDLIEERDYWRMIATKQMDVAEKETEEAFATSEKPKRKPRNIKP